MPKKPSIKIRSEDVDEGVECVFKGESKVNINEELILIVWAPNEIHSQIFKAGFEPVEEDIKQDEI